MLEYNPPVVSSASVNFGIRYCIRRKGNNYHKGIDVAPEEAPGAIRGRDNVATIFSLHITPYEKVRVSK